MITDYYAQHEIHNREREIIHDAEVRRRAAEGDGAQLEEKFKGDRMALAAALARLARSRHRPAVARPSC